MNKEIERVTWENTIEYSDQDRDNSNLIIGICFGIVIAFCAGVFILVEGANEVIKLSL